MRYGWPIRRLTVLLAAASLVIALTNGQPAWDQHTPEANPSNSQVERAETAVSGGGTVHWDDYSLVLNGQRIFLWSGEFHPWRLPVPALWRDVLQKIKALGMNAISIYVHWGLTNPGPGVFDFDDYRGLVPLFEMATEIGLWIVLRPGPYINAETTAGGIPHWVTSTVTSHLRDNSTSYYDSWAPYIKIISKISQPYQITNGGPIIAMQMENEYVDRDDVGYPGKKEMMQQLKDVFLENGIDVPLTINDAYMGANYVNGTGAGDIYGFDSYPQNFDCAHPDTWNPLVTSYWDFHQRTNPDQPLYIPEFQGGAYDAWGPSAPGYDACKQLTGANFESVFNLHLWASNAKMVNIYMVYGGTSWGHLPFPGVYTSYDYGAAISENRDIESPKYAELKRQGLFLRSVPDFYKTDVMGNSTTASKTTDQRPVVEIDNPDVLGTLLRNPDTGAQFYIVRHANSTREDTLSFHLNISLTTSSASTLSLWVPLTGPIQLHGRQSKIIATHLDFPSVRHGAPGVISAEQVPLSGDSVQGPAVLYTTASIFYMGRMGEREIIVFHGDTEAAHEIVLRDEHAHQPAATASQFLRAAHDARLPHGYTLFNVLPGLSGMLPLIDTKDRLVYYADSTTTGTIWAPTLDDADAEANGLPFANFWGIGTNSSVLVSGPYFVRSASYSKKHHRLDLYGDLHGDRDTYLGLLFEPEDTEIITWNGMSIGDLEDFKATASSMRTFLLRPANVANNINAFDLPELENWEFADSLPEINPEFDDSEWTTAKNTTTNLPYKPLFGEKVLYGCDYGFCEGVVLWRGHFTATGNESSVRLAINGGEAFAASVYINDVFLRTTYGNSTSNKNIVRETDEVYVFPRGSLREGAENVITVVQDNMGLDETWNHWDTDGSRSPRGIRGYELKGGTFDHWKVQGKVGGYEKFLDKRRGIFNEGGLFAERLGWHLPFSEPNRSESHSTRWQKREPSAGLPPNTRYAELMANQSWAISKGGHAGVGFFRTTFKLNIPKGYDAMMSFEFTDLSDDDLNPTRELPPYRALLFVNGWMMGKRIGNLGPQTKFPVHEGILDYRGENTLALALWSMDATAAVHPDLRLAIDKMVDGGFSALRTAGDISHHLLNETD